MRDGNEMSPILDVMKDSTTMPAELVDTWEDSWKNSQLSKVTFSFFVFYITPTTSFFLLQILYKEGMKCTQEKARNRPKMKEVSLSHFVIFKTSFPPTDQVYEELLRCESHSPTPYELQQQFDSAEKNPFLAQRPTIPGQVLRQEAPIEQPQRQNPVQHLPSETLPTVLPSVLPGSTPQNEEDGFLPDLVVLGGGSDNLSGPDIDSLLPTTLGATGGELVKSGENFNYSDDFTSESINSNSTYASDSTYQVMCICILVLPGFFLKMEPL